MSIVQAPMPLGEITGKVLFYGRPEPLTPEAHGKLAITPKQDPFAFAAGAHIVPIQISEFGLACMSYPIIFAGDQKTPMAILGLRQGENLFVNRAGRYAENAYIPGFIRRYPFVLAGDADQEQLVVCIDREASMLSERGEVPLFKDGKLTPFAEQAVQFCSEFENDRRHTDQFVARMVELDLFEPKAATFRPRNEDGSLADPIQLADYFAVSEEKVNALSDADLRELQTTGALRQVHAHVLSMLNWDRLVVRAAAQQATPTAPNSRRH